MLCAVLLAVIAFVVLYPILLLLINSFRVDDFGRATTWGVANWQAAFSQPRIDIPGQSGFGNSGRNLVNAPGLANYDLSAFKNIRLTERIRWQLRFEAFNAFNHTQFLYPDANVNSPTFGVIGSARPGRIIQYGTKLIW